MDVSTSYNNKADEWIARLARGSNHAHSLLEKPAMAALTPDLHGKRVLAIGCGSAEEVEMFLAKGANEADIVGIDVSDALITTARERFPAATFHVCPMENLAAFADGVFDFVYSSLTFHYAFDWVPILAGVRRVLKPGGRLILSTHHPVKFGAAVTRSPHADTFMMGYVRPKNSSPTVMGDYLGTREVKDTWFGNMEDTYYHRPLSAIMADLLGSGLTLRGFHEPKPTPNASEVNPWFSEIHNRVPLFMIFDLEKLAA